MPRPSIAFDRGEMVSQLRGELSRVCSAAHQAVLFIHPGYNTDSALWSQVQRLKQLNRLHRYRNARCVIDRTSAKIPGIQVPRYDDDLFRMFAPLEIGDDVIARGIR